MNKKKERIMRVILSNPDGEIKVKQGFGETMTTI